MTTLCAHVQWWSPWRRKNVEKRLLAVFVEICFFAIDRNGFSQNERRRAEVQRSRFFQSLLMILPSLFDFRFEDHNYSGSFGHSIIGSCETIWSLVFDNPAGNIKIENVVLRPSCFLCFQECIRTRVCNAWSLHYGAPGTAKFQVTWLLRIVQNGVSVW